MQTKRVAVIAIAKLIPGAWHLKTTTHWDSGVKVYERSHWCWHPHQAVNIDPATQLSNGTKIQDLNDLKRYLLTEKESDFRRAVVKKVMSYGLGRYLEFADRPAIDSVCENLQETRRQVPGFDRTDCAVRAFFQQMKPR